MPSPRLPAEWEPQDAVLLAWPHEKTDWQPLLADIQQTCLTLIQHICRHQKVILIVPDQKKFESVQSRLLEKQINSSNIIPVFARYNDTWLRDSGPISVIVGNQVSMIDFRFNGWGNKFEHELDDELCRNLFQQLSINKTLTKRSELVLEGGSIDSDGDGTLLTTQQCLLNPNRNAGTTRKDYEALFYQELGINKVYWLNSGELIGDDTDGHIDMLARFCNPDTIAFCSCDNKNDPHYLPLFQLKEELEKLRNRDDQGYDLVDLPIPAPIYNDTNERLPASYCNFLILNKAVLVPVYNDPNDEVACERLAKVFTGREIIPVNALVIIQQGGSLHCLTMQLPAGSFIQNDD